MLASSAATSCTTSFFAGRAASSATVARALRRGNSLLLSSLATVTGGGAGAWSTMPWLGSLAFPRVLRFRVRSSSFRAVTAEQPFEAIDFNMRAPHSGHTASPQHRTRTKGGPSGPSPGSDIDRDAAGTPGLSGMPPYVAPTD